MLNSDSSLLSGMETADIEVEDLLPRPAAGTYTFADLVFVSNAQCRAIRKIADNSPLVVCNKGASCSSSGCRAFRDRDERASSGYFHPAKELGDDATTHRWVLAGAMDEIEVDLLRRNHEKVSSAGRRAVGNSGSRGRHVNFSPDSGVSQLTGDSSTRFHTAATSSSRDNLGPDLQSTALEDLDTNSGTN